MHAMRYASLTEFLATGRGADLRGPVALIFAEDTVELASTLTHCQTLGFKTVLLFANPRLPSPEDWNDHLHRIDLDVHAPGAVPDAVNRVAAQAPGVWFYYGYNAEYLFFPFSEHRTIGELLAFHAEERRDAMFTTVVDLYASAKSEAPNGVCRDDAQFDPTGYFALDRRDGPDGPYLDRQIDLYGGLRWRMEDHVPRKSRRIDRIALFRARKDVRLLEGHMFSEPEFNTVSCPWHHNLTAAICSFRAAKALRTNPGTRFEIGSLAWDGSVSFEWTSDQLLRLGLIETGQWF